MGIEWRTCSACHEHYEGEFGECPKCAKAHKSSSKNGLLPGKTRKHGNPTLNIQEGNNNADNR